MTKTTKLKADRTFTRGDKNKSRCRYCGNSNRRMLIAHPNGYGYSCRGEYYNDCRYYSG